MPRKSGAYSEGSREFLSQEIKHHIKDKGMPQDQAVAAAMSEARRSGRKVPEETRKRVPKKTFAERSRVAAGRTGAPRKKATGAGRKTMSKSKRSP